ncbi:MAG: tRNA/rRNA methyltransferase [Bacteroidales bacterium]
MKIYFILVEPTVPENIGAAARAIKTMGFSRLRLVNPVDHLTRPSLWMAHASHEILENARVYHSLNEAIFDIDFVIATSSKKRAVKFDYFAISELADILKGKKKSINKVGIVFGKEKSGLKNSQIRKCDIVSYIPMISKYPSLNLAMTVMVYAFELSKLNLHRVGVKSTRQEESVYKIFKNKLDRVLIDIDIKQDSNLYNRILERAAVLNDNDIHLLLSIINRI